MSAKLIVLVYVMVELSVHLKRCNRHPPAVMNFGKSCEKPLLAKLHYDGTTHPAPRAHRTQSFESSRPLLQFAAGSDPQGIAP